MTYKLYGNKGSGSFPVEAALAKVGAKVELVDFDLAKGDQNDPAFVAINPMKQVPALILPDGTLMTESAAMCIHLADAHPGKGLAPASGTPAHARFLRWMVFMATNLYEADLRYFYADRYTTDPAGVEGVKASGAQHMAKACAIVEAALKDGPFLAGRDMSLADVYLAMLVKWSPEPVTAPHIAAIVGKVAADPVYGPVAKRHGFAG
ncbi:MAG: glutathione S-transferase family protein [Hyphomicrobiaceae bacterium]